MLGFLYIRVCKISTVHLLQALVIMVLGGGQGLVLQLIRDKWLEMSKHCFAIMTSQKGRPMTPSHPPLEHPAQPLRRQKSHFDGCEDMHLPTTLHLSCS